MNKTDVLRKNNVDKKLEKFLAKDVMLLLVELLDHANVHVRKTALHLSIKINAYNKELLPILMPKVILMLKDKELSVRIAAIAVMGRLQTQDNILYEYVHEILHKILTDDNYGIREREAAMEALVFLN